MNTDSRTPLSVLTPGGTCIISGDFRIFLIIVTDKGFVPELAVTAVSPLLLNARPKGCGATVMLFPAGVRRRPFGITVTPSLLIEVYWFSAGAEIVKSLVFRSEQEMIIKDEIIRHRTLPEIKLKKENCLFIK